jgi:hypothetical protein
MLQVSLPTAFDLLFKYLHAYQKGNQKAVLRFQISSFSYMACYLLGSQMLEMKSNITHLVGFTLHNSC